MMVVVLAYDVGYELCHDVWGCLRPNLGSGLLAWTLALVKFVT